MRLEYQHRDGAQGIPRTNKIECRLTIPAREALQRAGSSVEITDRLSDIGAPVYLVRLDPDLIAPDHIHACRVIGDSELCLRMDDEPEYPGEIEDYWGSLLFRRCPECGHPLAWYEAGNVPGYRVCTGEARHHVLAMG